MTTSYDGLLVVMSLVIAVLASYTALGLGGRVIHAERRYARYWIVGGAVALGVGIWAMHFVGMLAFHLPVPVAFDPLLTGLSIVPAIAASAIALYVLCRRHRNSLPFYAAALLMGGGIAAMHYTGMAAMRMFPDITYDRGLLVLSVVIAVLASGVALELVYRLSVRTMGGNLLGQIAAALVMGAAIAGMHYTGMAAANFADDAVCLAVNDGIGGPVLTVLVVAGGLLILFFAIAAVVLDKLRDQNAFYSTLLKAQSDVGEGVMVLERERVVFANPAMAMLTGRTAGELGSGTAVYDLFRPDGHPQLRERLADEGLPLGDIQRCELDLVDAPAGTGHVEVTFAQFLHRTRVRTLVLCMDITERTRSLQALQASEEKLRAMFDFSPLGIALCSSQGRLVESNPALERMTGYRADELAKLDFYDLVPNRFRRDIDRLHQEVADNGRFGPLEVELINRGSGRLWVTLNGVLVTGPTGDQYLWSTVEDVTDRVQVTDKLKQLNETLEERVNQRTLEVEGQRQFIEAVLDTAGGLVMLLDRGGRIVRFNKACEDLSGYAFSELRNTCFWDALVPPEQVDAVQRQFNHQVNSGEHARYETEWRTRGGELRAIAWSNAVLMGQSGRVQHVIATGIDVTERKRAEQALKEANRSLQKTVASLTEAQDKLVQSEKMASLGGLVAGISHEINTPLGVGVTSATNIREELGRLQQAFANNTMKRSTLERFVDHVDQASDILLTNLRRASELITSFKQVAVDQSSDDWRRLNLREYVDEIILSLKPRWKNLPVELVNDCDPTLQIYTHPGAIYQILSNCIVNSLIHAFDPEQEGRIRIAAGLREGELELRYTDDGKGMPESVQARVFDPFFTTRRGAGGSGLGMHIVYNLVRGTLGGDIELASTPGQGVEFRMRLPLTTQEQHG